MAGVSAPRAFSEGSWSPLSASDLSPQTQEQICRPLENLDGTQLLPGRLTSQAKLCTQRRASRLGPRTADSVNHQPARGPIRRSDGQRPASGHGCTSTWPPPLVPRPRAFSHPAESGRASCPSERTANPSPAHGCGYRYGRGPGRPLTNLAPWVTRTGPGLAKPVPAPRQVPPRPQEQVLCERKSPGG